MEAVIRIEDFRVSCIIGNNLEEREAEQEIAIDIEIRIDITECAQTDSIVDTVDYEKLVKVCSELAKSRRYHLLETFAYEAIDAVFDEFSVLWARIRVKKKAFAEAKWALVELEMKK